MTIAELAARTGVPAGTLRVWRARHGFPAPSPGTHRSDADVAAIRAVIRWREQGLSLAAAIAKARQADGGRSDSIFAALRRTSPHLQPQTASKPALVALSRAIEDERAATASRALLIGSFQRERHYRESERRWRELSRTGALTVALADFERQAQPEAGPIEVPLPATHDLIREWAVISYSPEAAACLSAWEIVGSGEPADAERRFEAIWTFEPATVHAAARTAAALIEPIAPSIALRLSELLSEPPQPSRPELRAGAALATRAFGYLAARI